MPILPLCYEDDRWETPRGDAAIPALAREMATLEPGAPIIVLIHGFGNAPGHATRCPHKRIFSLTPSGKRRAVSWPRHLGFGRGDPREGLCIAIGWPARGLLWQVFQRAGRVGAALAELLDMMGDVSERPVDIVAHSLGGRVALAALRSARAGRVGRIILMAGAEFQATAASAMASPAGQSAEVINLVSRENRVFDVCLQLALRPGRATIAAGLPARQHNWVDLPIDRARMRSHLMGLGHTIPAPPGRVCHWWGYLRPGLFGLYRDLLRSDPALPLAALAPPRSQMWLAVPPKNPMLRVRRS